ncbi:MAG: energy transducer TonB [Ignavibacteriales bacterium]|nr:energy transducer TonB [Ignavibacteriales bacterium]
MKKHSYLLACLIAISGLMYPAHAQDKKLPSPDKEIPYDKEPALVNKVNPVYPASMLRGGWEATVYMKAFIDVDGSVLDAKSEKILVTATKSDDKDDESAGQKTDGKAFVEAAYNALKQWKFSPAQMQGKPVAVWVTIPIRFRLSTKEIKPGEEADHAKMEKSIESIKTTIENILKGTEIEKARKRVGKEALLIYNTKTENLYSVLNGEHNDIHFTEGKEAKCVNFNIKITDGGNSALIVWTSELPKGKNKRIHSIVLSKNAAKDWQIIHWHVSW